MRSLKWAAIAMASMVLLGCQVKQEKETLEQLTGAEVQALFVGHTVESFNVISGVTSFSYYAPDGRVEQERYWEKRAGVWRINDKSEMCMSMEGKSYRCRGIYRKGNKYYKYRIGKNGELEKVIRYRQFIAGNVVK